jgi:predicted RNA-binding Zn ribbon-like protein
MSISTSRLDPDEVGKEDRMTQTTPPPAPGELSSVALAFANTLLSGPSGNIDLIRQPDAAAAWLSEHALPIIGPVRPDDAVRLVELRTAIRDILTALPDQRTPNPEAVNKINTSAAAAPGAVQLTWSYCPQQTWTPTNSTTLSATLALFATDAIELVSGPRAQQLRRCEAHGCIRIFLREHARRRWCSDTCGDRVRSARHYQRHQHQDHA